MFSGFELLCFLGLVNGFSGFYGGLLMTEVMVVALFSVFCFAMDCGCHDGGGVAAAALLWLLFIVLDILFYCVIYIIFMCSKYYFNL